MSTTDKNIIPEKNIREAIKEVEKIAKEGVSGNTVIHKKELTRADVVKLDEGRPYIDQLPDGQLRLRYRCGNKMYHIPMTETDLT